MSTSGPPVQVSPVNRIAKYFVAHKRDVIETFRYDDAIHKPQPFPSSKAFLTFLDFQTNVFQAPNATPILSMDGFIAAANLVATSIQKDHFPSKEILEFKNTDNKTLLGHVPDTKCRPNITAAFRSDWNQNGVTLWPCAQLAVERASNGKSKAQQEKNAISYLHYLLLARPDLYVAQGLLIDDSKITFLLGIGGYQIRRLDVRWGDEELYKLLYAFIYSLYNTDLFADKSYSRTKVDWIEEIVEYTVQIRIPSTTPDGSAHIINCANFRAIAARNPFTTRTHVLSNPIFEEDVNGKVLTVLKDQLCRAGTRFDEKTALEAIHRKGVVPGVVEVVHHETIQNCWSKLTERDKHRFGLRQFGLPFASIPTPRQVLEVLFDLLEVLRYLHSECHVLHRDISAGNVLYTDNSSGNSRANVEIAGAVKATTSSHSYAAGQEPSDLPVFVKYLLGQSDDKQQTSMLLIDFNRAELLNRKQSSEHLRMGRIGTQLFMARAVENTAPVPFTSRTFLPEVPQIPGFYGLNHPTRIEKFPFTGESRTLTKPEREQSSWRHGLEHDVESVFWLLLYWAIVVQPANHEPEPVHPGAWGFFLGNAQDRNSLVRLIANNNLQSGIIHPTYTPLGPLIRDLASILVMDRQWLVESDVRNDSMYICEAFQRLILCFLLRNTHQDFMDVEADVQFRSVDPMPQSEIPSASISERFAARSAVYTETKTLLTAKCTETPMAALNRMRPLSPSVDDIRPKRRRLTVAQTENQADVGMEHMDDDDSDDGDFVPF